MRKITALLASAAATLAVLAPAGAAQAADARYNADAAMTGTRTCEGPKTGITRTNVRLINRGTKRAQFKVVRQGDARAPQSVYVWVPAKTTKTLPVAIPEARTVSVRVRVPEMGTNNLVLSATATALANCEKAVYQPKAQIGQTSCVDGDTVVQVILNNLGSTHVAAPFEGNATANGLDHTFGASVEPRTARKVYLSLDGAQSTQVTVTADGKTLLDQSVSSIPC